MCAGQRSLRPMRESLCVACRQSFAFFSSKGTYIPFGENFCLLTDGRVEESGRCH